MNRTDSSTDASRNDIIQPLIRNTFLQGPPGLIALPVDRSLDPGGRHFDPDEGSILEQFDKEILRMILGHLDPVWLFQLEKAIPEMCRYLTSEKSNLDWYNAVPAPLLLEPERFQSETQKSLRVRHFTASMGEQTLPDGHLVNISDKEMRQMIMPRETSSLIMLGGYGRAPNKYTLPRLDNISMLAEENDKIMMRYVAHPRGSDLQYPLIRLDKATFRTRVLAIGGPYDKTLSYRRELLGNMLSSRCCLCLEGMGPNFGGEAFKLQFCIKCWDSVTVHLSVYEKHHVTGDDVLKTVQAGIPINKLLPNGQIWLPHADEICRATYQIDLGTALAKKAYLHQLARYKNKEDRLSSAQRKLRIKILEAAQKIWTDPAHPGRELVAGPTKAQIEYMNQSFLPARKLGDVLFSPLALAHEALLIPSEDHKGYPVDPTLGATRHAVAVDWLEDDNRVMVLAADMLGLLWTTKSLNTKLVQLAQNYHVARLREAFDAKNPTKHSQRIADHHSEKKFKKGMRITLAKLQIEPDETTAAVALTATSKAMHDARELLPGIIGAACSLCPATAQVSPRGLRAVVDHIRLVSIPPISGPGAKSRMKVSESALMPLSLTLVPCCQPPQSFTPYSSPDPS
jgi:hypothetical protein